MCFSVLIIENRVFWIELWIPKPRCWLVGLVPGSCPIFDFWKNRWWCKFVNTPNSIFKKLDFNLYKARKGGYIQNRLKKSVCPILFTHLWGTIKCPINKKDCFFSCRMDFINFGNLSPNQSDHIKWYNPVSQFNLPPPRSPPPGEGVDRFFGFAGVSGGGI